VKEKKGKKSPRVISRLRLSVRRKGIGCSLTKAKPNKENQNPKFTCCASGGGGGARRLTKKSGKRDGGKAKTPHRQISAALYLEVAE